MAFMAAPAGAAIAVHGAAATGGIGLRLVDAPVSARDDPRARIYIVDHLNPGTTINRRIEVSNTTDATAGIALYPSAASIDKGSFLGAAGHTANDLSTWTSVVPGEPEVPAGGKLMANVTIAVPDDAGKSGLDVLVELRERHPLTPVVVMSGTLSGPASARSQELGAAESIEKLALVARIPGLVERYRHTPVA